MFPFGFTLLRVWFAVRTCGSRARARHPARIQEAIVEGRQDGGGHDSEGETVPPVLVVPALGARIFAHGPTISAAFALVVIVGVCARSSAASLPLNA
jgi:hypothetical protein